LGIDRRRLPPPFAKETFAERCTFNSLLQRAPATALSPLTAQVLLFPDTFVSYYEPEVGMAAVELFDWLRYPPLPGLPEYLKGAALKCCGRPLISNGLLSEAVECARHNVEVLYPWAADGQTITACEPSCLLTLQDDYPALLRGELRRQAETVAGRCRT